MPANEIAAFVLFFPKKSYFCGLIFETDKINYTIMGTELKRKDRKNKARANNKIARIKQLLRRPEIKNVDVEAIKASFAEKKAAAAA